MSQNGQTYFKNLAASVPDPFGTLFIKGWKYDWNRMNVAYIYYSA